MIGEHDKGLGSGQPLGNDLDHAVHRACEHGYGMQHAHHVQPVGIG